MLKLLIALLLFGLINSALCKNGVGNPNLMTKRSHGISKREISTDLLTELDEIRDHLAQLYDFHNNQEASFIANVTKLEKKLEESETKLEQKAQESESELQRKNTELQQMVTNLEQKLQESKSELQKKTTQLEQKVDKEVQKLQELQNEVTNANANIDSLQLEKLDMKQNLKELEAMLHSQIETSKHNITELQNDLQETFEMINSTFSRPNPMLEWFESTNETRKVGRLISFETNVDTDIQNGGCGGILDGLSGEIRYESPSNLMRNQHSKLRCIWTIRANKKEQVKFQLVADTLGESELRFNGLWKLWLGDLNNQTKTVRSGHHTEFTLKGYVMFVTLVADSVGPLSFTLKYEGIGDDTGYSLVYSHYHFTESAGSVDFPRIRGDTKYSRYELATFVINPTIPTSALRIQTTKVDTQNYNDCVLDSLSHYVGKRNQSGYYKLDGPSSTRNRYCGQLGSLRDAFSGGQGTETFISVFVSGSDTEYSGFTFNWTS